MTDHCPSIPHAIRRTARSLSSTIPTPVALRRVVASAALLAVAAPAQASENLKLIPEVTPLAILVVVFGVLIFPVNALIFKPIMKALAEREARIQGARDRSSYLQREADSVLDRYETAIREAHEEAARTRRTHLEGAKREQVEITSTARGEAERQLEQARSALKGSFEEARGSLRSQAQELAREAAATVLGRSL